MHFQAYAPTGTVNGPLLSLTLQDQPSLLKEPSLRIVAAQFERQILFAWELREFENTH